MKELKIGQNDAGQRLDRFLSKAVPLLPASLLQKYIRLKRIKKNGKKATREEILQAGDILQLYINDEFFDAPAADNAYLRITAPKLDILYEDENILLIDKAPGIAVHDGDGLGSTLIDHVRAYLYQSGQWRPREEQSFSPALCNRIDRNTGGIVIAAKNAQSLRILNEKIKNREVEKRYLAICEGSVPAQGRLIGYLTKDDRRNRVEICNQPQEDAKYCETRYRLLEYRNGLSLVECALITGRTHQIRAQFAHDGFPLLGDVKYGAKPCAHKYQALYAYHLAFRFTSDAGALSYLHNREFRVKDVSFVADYFPNNMQSKPTEE
ncbi:MAG: RluA family pseudouridine synthase [Oscillospiraceae bacterium]|nr:RluA family pseudouridine synthase [Oscillospiraceae bacterium]